MLTTIELPDDLLNRLDALEPFTMKSRETIVRELLAKFVRVEEARRNFAEGNESIEDVERWAQAASRVALRDIEW